MTSSHGVTNTEPFNYEAERRRIHKEFDDKSVLLGILRGKALSALTMEYGGVLRDLCVAVRDAFFDKHADNLLKERDNFVMLEGIDSTEVLKPFLVERPAGFDDPHFYEGSAENLFVVSIRAVTYNALLDDFRSKVKHYMVNLQGDVVGSLEGIHDYTIREKAYARGYKYIARTAVLQSQYANTPKFVECDGLEEIWGNKEEMLKLKTDDQCGETLSRALVCNEPGKYSIMMGRRVLLYKDLDNE